MTSGPRHPEEHQPSGLDLRAVEALIANIEECIDRTEDEGYIVDAADALTALLVHVRALRAALVQANVPYSALLMDRESRRWIAPSIWQAMETSREAAFAVLYGVQDPEG